MASLVMCRSSHQGGRPVESFGFRRSKSKSHFNVLKGCWVGEMLRGVLVLAALCNIAGDAGAHKSLSRGSGAAASLLSMPRASLMRLRGGIDPLDRADGEEVMQRPPAPILTHHPVNIFATTSPAAALQAGFASVVKVFAWTTEPHFSQPWQMRRQRHGTGSGFIIHGRRILTNAHNIANQNWVLVQRHGIPRKYPAKVLAVGHECDLALLSVEEDEFWEGTCALEFGSVPELQQSLVVVGFPTGGDNLCVTAGVVSRVDVHEYAHSGFSLLCVQIDAALNSGNSGGPALNAESNQVIGVAFQGREDAENVGFIIPSSVVNHFLQDIERNGVYSGFVTLGMTWAPLENKSLRKYTGIDSCGMPDGCKRSGVLVCKVDGTRHTDETLKQGDTLLAVDGVCIADDGTMPFREMERLAFSHLISQRFLGDTCTVTVLRGGNVMNRSVSLSAPRYLVPECVYDTPPRYFIVGGIVFVPLTLNYLLHEFGKRYYEKAPNALLSAMEERFQTLPGEEVVVLSQMLASEISSGYDGIRNMRLATVNGERVLNLKHLRDLVAECKDKFLVFGLSQTQTVVLDREEAIEASQQILLQHSIASSQSEVL